MAKLATDKLYVVAIDFGTTYSGYAFSTTAEYKRDPLKINASVFTSINNISMKTSTCVLFDPRKKFHSFGYEAEDKFSDLTEDNEHHEWYFFRRFKMKLYHDENITKTTRLKDEQGNTMYALDVFAAAIRYMKNDMFEKKTIGDLREDDIQWVLTIPAIWNDTAKSFMRKAAQQAGIKGEQMILALEPEAAAIYCKHLPVGRSLSEKSDVYTFPCGTRYLVLDAGGGTVDITVHEVTPDQRVREVYKANGGDWGGTNVDEAFKEFLEDIFSKIVMDSFAVQYRADNVELYRGFEVRKRNISKKVNDKLTIKIPVSLMEVFIDMNPNVKIKDAIRSNTKYASSVSLCGDKLRIDAEVAKTWFQTSVERIVKHLHDLFRKKHVDEVRCILMVGGFSESLMLQESIKTEYGTKMHIIIPQEPGLAVLKGAVIFGHNQSVIKTRICRYTYGILCSQPFIEGVHPETEKFRRSDGTFYCNNLVLKIIEEGTEIAVGQPSKPQMLCPLEYDDVIFQTCVVSSKRRNVKFSSDEGCKVLGSLSIDMPDTTKGFDRQVIYTMIFGDTELKVRAKDRDSNREVIAQFKFI